MVQDKPIKLSFYNKPPFAWLPDRNWWSGNIGAWLLLLPIVLVSISIPATILHWQEASTRFGLALGLSHSLEYWFLPITYTVIWNWLFVSGVGLLSQTIVGMTKVRWLSPLAGGVVLAITCDLSLSTLTELTDLQSLFHGRPFISWHPSNTRLAGFYIAISLLVGATAFGYFAKDWHRWLWRHLRTRRIIVFVIIFYSCTFCIALLLPMVTPVLDQDRKNVILISMDTLRQDHVGTYGYDRDTTPNIDRLAKQGIVFEKALSQAPWTLPAHISLFTALYPSEHGLTNYSNERNQWKLLTPETPLLAEVLQKNGYVTAAYTGGGFVSPELGFGRGFDIYYSKSRRLERFQPNIMQWLDRNRRWPFFLFLHFYNCHRHYKPPPPFNTIFLPSGTPDLSKQTENFCVNAESSGVPPGKTELDYIISQYDGEIRFADGLLGEIFSYIEQTGLSENTLIIFLSDHGDEFFEHGNCDHLKSLYDPLVMIPLIFKGPKLPSGLRVHEPVELRHVPHMLLEYLEIEEGLGRNPKYLQRYTTARKNNSKKRELTTYTETDHKGYTIQNGAWHHGGLSSPIHAASNGIFKLIADAEGKPLEFYDLQRDISEQDNLIGHSSDKQTEQGQQALHSISKQLTGHLERIKSKDSPARESISKTLDNNTLKQLKALGYLQ